MNKNAQGRWKVGMSNTKLKMRVKNEPSPTSQKYLPESMVGGVAMLDYNGDDLLDLYFVNGAGLEDPMPPEKSPDKSEPRYWNRLYRNNGDGTFSDTTESAGVAGESYGQGVAVGDYDNDGRPDLYVTNFGPNNLYHNEGDGAFREVTREAGVSGGGWSAGAMFVDYDHDGHLDLIVSRYLIWDFDNNRWCGEKKPGYRAYCHPDHFDPVIHIVYHNNGDGTFGEVTKASGVGASPRQRPGSCVQRLRPRWLARPSGCQRLGSSTAVSQSRGWNVRRGWPVCGCRVRCRRQHVRGNGNRFCRL